MKFYMTIFSTLLFVVSGLTYQSCVTEASASTPSKTETTKQWTSLDNANELSKKENKKILIDVYTDWCKWCKVMDEKTFQSPEIKSHLADNYHLVKFNAEQKNEIVFNGKVYNFVSNGRRGSHALASELLNGQLSYPSLVVLDSELNKLQTIRGYKSPEQLSQILNSK